MYKTKITTLLILLLGFVCYSQKAKSTKKREPSKEETQTWIREKINSYSYKSGKEIKYKYNISFVANEIIVNDEEEMFLNVPTPISYCSERTIIADIDFISFEENDSFIWLVINLKNGIKKPCVCDNKIISNDSEIAIALEKSFKNNDLPERMIKAFKRLVELYGGKKATIKEPF